MSAWAHNRRAFFNNWSPLELAWRHGFIRFEGSFVVALFRCWTLRSLYGDLVSRKTALDSLRLHFV